MSAPLNGFVENLSRTEWSTQARNAQNGTLDLSQYNLKITLSLTDRTGKFLTAEDGTIDGVFGVEGGTLTYKLPADGWYALIVQRDDSAGDNQGYAWLKTSSVEIFPSQESAALRREEDYGPMPTPANPLTVAENNYRFEGPRTLREFLSLQILPFVQHTVFPLIVGAALFFNGWLIGVLGKNEKIVRRAVLIAWILSIPRSGDYPVWDFRLAGPARSSPGGLGRAAADDGPDDCGHYGVLPDRRRARARTAQRSAGGQGDVHAVHRSRARRAVDHDPVHVQTDCAVLLRRPFKDMDLTIRMMIGLTLFTAAYQAENVRGGLQVIPHGQIEAARALGLNPLMTTTFIVLPQALRAVIPAIVGQFISAVQRYVAGRGGRLV